MPRVLNPNWPVVDSFSKFTPVVSVYIPSEEHKPDELYQGGDCEYCGVALRSNRKQIYCPVCGQEAYLT